MSAHTEIAVLIVAGGSGSRMGGIPKQYRDLAGEPILARTIRAFASALPGAPIQTVIAAGDEALADEERLGEPLGTRARGEIRVDRYPAA